MTYTFFLPLEPSFLAVKTLFCQKSCIFAEKLRNMKWLRSVLLGLCCGLSIMGFAQFEETFADGNYTQNPTWVGDYASFGINAFAQLQTKLTHNGTSYLATPCKVNQKAEWSFWGRIATQPTAYNYLRFYILSTTQDPMQGEGWYVQIGGKNKNIALYHQTQEGNQKVIENEERKLILDQDDNQVWVRVTLDENGVFHLFSQVKRKDTDYVSEGEYGAGLQVGWSAYFAILVRNTAQTGYLYYADDISVTGQIDTTFTPDPSDPNDTIRHGSTPQMGDLVINEIMYDPAKGGQEFLEIYNRSENTLDLSDVYFTARNSKGEFAKRNEFRNAFIRPHSCAALCKDRDSLFVFHDCPPNSSIWSGIWNCALLNSGTDLKLAMDIHIDSALVQTVVLDSLSYQPNWHHPLLTDTKGVSLERIHPDLPSTQPLSWHSASEEAGFATPGQQNSQYRDIYADENEKKPFVWLAQESFSPNGDGFEDVCLLHYEVAEVGFVANLRIFTPNGLLVYQSPKNEILALQGELIWDGRTQNNTTAQVGVYVIFCEFTNPLTGRTLRRKLPIALSAR